MAKNDKILIDGIIDYRVELNVPSSKRDEAFEYFVFEQMLKDYDLSSDEIKQGSVDGRNDGGIDGFFIFVNGHDLTNPETFNWPKSGSVLEVWIITCKHHDTFKQAPLDNLAASIFELLDFTIDSSSLKGDYSELIIRQRENLKLAYRKVSPRLSEFSINFCYASRGNTNELGESIVSRSKQIVQSAKDAFGNSVSTFLFYGSTELIDLHRKAPNFSLELPFIEDLSSGQTYILLVNLEDYYNFIQDNGKLRRYLFDSNVRDFMGLNRVNEDIRSTLFNLESPDFWWLNNGVTILATGASVIGKSIQIQDIQIVNGLQTSESIYRHFQNEGRDPNKRSVLVKVIVSNDNKIRDEIIRATNNQTVVELASLHATDKIQRDIEDILKQSDFYYERRTNFYKNQGISPDKIVTPLYISAGYVNLILKEIDQASRLKSKFMRIESSYNKVFSFSTDLKIWPQIAYILKTTDKFLEAKRFTNSGGSEHFLKRRRQMLSFLTVSKILGTFNFSVNDLVNLNMSDYNNVELDYSWELLKTQNIDIYDSAFFNKSHINRILKRASENWNILGIERFISNKIHKLDTSGDEFVIDLDFALKVKELLPIQPWKKGIAKQVIAQLECSNRQFHQAIKLLRKEGLIFYQKEGVVYDNDGNVIAVDNERTKI